MTVEVIEQSLDKAAVRYDRDGDQHYDVVSAFIKSVRGSDVDAALHYLARMLTAGEDPRFIARRLTILASEDVGMADPTALLTAVAAAQTVQLIGMPEAQLTLAHATVHLATAPKSNAVTMALAAAMGDIKAGKAGLVPPHLRDGHYSGAAALGNAQGYSYPHDAPGWHCPATVFARRPGRRGLLPADDARRGAGHRRAPRQVARDSPQTALAAKQPRAAILGGSRQRMVSRDLASAGSLAAQSARAASTHQAGHQGHAEGGHDDLDEQFHPVDAVGGGRDAELHGPARCR